MPWSNQGGGGGPWQPKNKGPWGGGPPNNSNNNGSSGPTPPNLEDMLRRSQEKLRRMIPGGGGGASGVGLKGAAVLGLLGVVLWMVFGGFYQVQPNQVGLEMVFGKFTGVTQPGLHYNWPAPLGRVYRPVMNQNAVEIGFRARAAGSRDVPEESLMLTGDENIVDVDVTVLWMIDRARPQDYQFNLKDPEGTVKAVAEAAMREIIGKRDIQPVLTSAREQIQFNVQELMQKVLNDYKAGITVDRVSLQKVDPPGQVIESFRDVQRARADQESAQNEAQTYANKVVPEARGEASKIVQRAEGERERLIAEARGQSVQFTKLHDEYKRAPEVTRQRLFLETIERVYGGMDKIIIDQKSSGGQGVVPYLPLNELNARRPAQTPPQGVQR